MTEKAIWFDKESGKFITPWGWVKLNFTTGQADVYGPGAPEWYDGEKAIRTATLFSPHCESTGMAFTLAVHQQYAAWKGARSLVR